mgnify:CR=1 FL=1
MKIIKLILMLGISFFIISCGGDSNESASNGWPESETSKMLSECMESPDSTKQMCDCAVEAAVSEFTYEEYMMLQNATTDTAISEEMQERGENFMIALMKCAL